MRGTAGTGRPAARVFPVQCRFDQTGVLLGSAVLATIGIYLLSTITGGATYFAAFIFALGISFFWPNMIGLTAEKIPASGAIGMSIVGAFGMFSTSIWQPIIGGWIDSAKVAAEKTGLTGDALELAAGQATLTRMMIYPAILVVLFTILYMWVKKMKAQAA